MRRPALVLLAGLVLSGCGSGDALRGTATEQLSATVGPAQELCGAIAHEHSGEVAAAYDTTVAAVRQHLADPHGADGDPSSGPVPGPYVFPEGWSAKAPDDAAVACYVDAVIAVSLPVGAPAADRGLFMATEGAAPLLVKAGPRASMELVPLRTRPSESRGPKHSTAAAMTGPSP